MPAQPETGSVLSQKISAFVRVSWSHQAVPGAGRNPRYSIQLCYHEYDCLKEDWNFVLCRPGCFHFIQVSSLLLQMEEFPSFGVVGYLIFTIQRSSDLMDPLDWCMYLFLLSLTAWRGHSGALHLRHLQLLTASHPSWPDSFPLDAVVHHCLLLLCVTSSAYTIKYRSIPSGVNMELPQCVRTLPFLSKAVVEDMQCCTCCVIIRHRRSKWEWIMKICSKATESPWIQALGIIVGFPEKKTQRSHCMLLESWSPSYNGGPGYWRF